MTIKRLLAITLTFIALSAGASETGDSTRTGAWRYIPDFTGTLRTFYRLNTDSGDSRFEIANARLAAGGYVMPWLDYFLQVDFCQRGKVRILDAFARLYPAEGLTLYMGQMRVPFSVESSRFPWKYHFADVGLTAHFGNLRSVGIKAGYTFPKTSLYVEGGIFNSADMLDHGVWNSAMTYGIRLNYTIDGFKPELSFMSRSGDANTPCRINMANASLCYTYGKLYAEAEYIYRYYGNPSLDPAHAWNAFAVYGFPVKWRMADKLSVEARYDGISATDTDWWTSHSRLTAGVTASRSIGKRLYVAFRINYEHYFYNADDTFPASVKHNNELIAGLTLHF